MVCLYNPSTREAEKYRNLRKAWKILFSFTGKHRKLEASLDYLDFKLRKPEQDGSEGQNAWCEV